MKVLAIWNGEEGSNFIKICQQSKVKKHGGGGCQKLNAPKFVNLMHMQ